MKKILLFVCLISIFFLVGCEQVKSPESEECQECEVCGACPEEKALITTSTHRWFINELNENEMFFSLTIYNYGYKEAKNVKIKCKLHDIGTDLNPKETLELETEENIGNIASTAAVYEEMFVSLSTNQIKDDHYYSAFCYPIDCDDCEILHNRIPELAEEITK